MTRFATSCVSFFILALAIGANDPIQKSEANGTLKGVFPDKREFLLDDGKGKQRSFEFEEHGKVLINNTEAKLGDLMPGEEVSVLFEMRMERAFASEIRCKRG